MHRNKSTTPMGRTTAPPQRPGARPRRRRSRAGLAWSLGGLIALTGSPAWAQQAGESSPPDPARIERPQAPPLAEQLPGADAKYYPGALRMAPRWPDDVPREPMMLFREAPRREIASAQIWLARTKFKPGVIDGRMGSNTRHALEAFQQEHELEVTGEFDEETRARLAEAAGADGRPDLIPYEVTEDDVDGPFSELPGDLYMAHELECMCYTGPLELLAEKAQTTEELVRRLNPGVDWDSLEAGTLLVLPDPVAARKIEGQATRIEVDTERLTLRAYDAEGNLLVQYPTVVGEDFADYEGGMSVEGLAVDGGYRLDPEMFESIPDDKEVVFLPPGPNLPTGNVWIELSGDGFGIHGTSSPSTIGHTVSHGCVRLTNWHAAELLQLVEPGRTEVEFKR